MRRDRNEERDTDRVLVRGIPEIIGNLEEVR